MDNVKLLKEVSKYAKIHKFTAKKHKSYLYKLAEYIEYFKEDIKNSKEENIEKYIVHLINKNLSQNEIEEILASLHFAFKKILKMDIVNLDLAKNKINSNISMDIPQFLTKEQIKILLNTIENEKHNLMIALIYSSGIKVSEFLNLKKTNIDFEKNFIKISNKKMSRIVPLSKKIKEDLKIHINKNSKKYLFENRSNQKYTSKTIELILKKASINLSIMVNPKMLRHSFAIHLFENGISIEVIQKLLGHTNIRSTRIYQNIIKVNLENIDSPLN